MNKKNKILSLVIAMIITLQSLGSAAVFAVEIGNSDAIFTENTTLVYDEDEVVAAELSLSEPSGFGHFSVVNYWYDNRVFEDWYDELSEFDGNYSDRNRELNEYLEDIAAQDIQNITPLFETFNATGVRGDRGWHIFGATRSTDPIGTANYGNIAIGRVQVMTAGGVQARYRHMSGGYRVYPASEGNNGYGYFTVNANGELVPVTGYFTESRNASLTDHQRRFVFYTELTSEQVGDSATFLSRIDYRYGDLPFEAWLGGTTLTTNTAAARLVHLQSHRLIAQTDDEGYAIGYTLETVVEFRSAVGATTGAINVPHAGYRGPGQANMPNAIRHVIGNFDFSVNIDGARLASIPVRLTQYDDFMLWDEINDWVLDLRDEAGGARGSINGRFVDVTSIGQSIGGRDIWNIVIAADAAAHDFYLNHTRRVMSESPESIVQLMNEVQEDEQAGRAPRHRLPLFFMNIHPDEMTGVCSQIAMMEQLLHGDYLVFNNLVEQPDLIWGAWPTTGFGNRFQRPTNFTTNEVRISVEEALERFIFVFVPTNNPDGRYFMRRGTFQGQDTNRDGAYQLHPGTWAVTTNAAKWSPLAILDFHGHVRAMLIEPVSGPHNYNKEYDLMLPWMLEAAHAMGQAVISGGYSSYHIPLAGMSHGWDDAGPLYVPVFMTLLGIKGFTLEIPAANQDSADANVSMGWGYTYFAMNNFEDLFMMKLEVKQRGLEGDDNHAVDAWLVDRRTATSENARNAAEASLTAARNLPYSGLATIPVGSTQNPIIGRQPTRDRRGSFFPDYWVIPVDHTLQTNLREALYNASKLANHSVSFEELTRPIYFEGVVYPEGTLIIDMRQATRGYINSMFAPAANLTPFTNAPIYAETAVEFPAARGFRADPIWASNLFDDATVPINMANPGNDPADTAPFLPNPRIAEGNSDYLVIANNSIDSIRLINRLLRENVNVWMLTEYNPAGKIGDILVARNEITSRLINGRLTVTMPAGIYPAQPFGPADPDRTADVFFESTALYVRPASAQALVLPNVILNHTGHPATNATGQGLLGESWFVLQDMGFTFQRIGGTAANLNAAVARGGNVVFGSALPAAFVSPINTHQLPFVAIGTGPAATAEDAALFGGRSHVSVNSGGVGDSGGSFPAAFLPGSALTERFNRHDLLHTIGNTRAYTAVPIGTVPLMRTLSPDEGGYFRGGFYTTAQQNAIMGRYFGFTGLTNASVPSTVIGINAIRRGHTRAMYPIIGTSIFMHTAGIEFEPLPFVTGEINDYVVTLAAGASAARGSNATIEEVWIRTSSNLASEVFNINTAESDGWIKHVPTAPSTNFILEPFDIGLRRYVHWFVINSDGVVNQGNIDFGLPKIYSITTSPGDFISINETARNSRQWIIRFNIDTAYVDGRDGRSFITDVTMPSNNANLSGIYIFDDNHKLSGRILEFDIRNNGRNIVRFNLR